MSNRRVKSVAHEDDYDDYDDFDDEPQDNGNNELSPEDEEQMRQGTVKVRAALGSAFPATDKEIQEALWHYYYDVPKSVAYLKSTKSCKFSKYPCILTFADNLKPQPTTKRQANDKKSKFRIMCSSSSVSPGRNGHDSLQSNRFQVDADQHQAFAASDSEEVSFSAVEFFEDTPWLQIPEYRRAEIIIEPAYPRGRLLGGASNAGKKSKLAALAARRRQKDNEQPISELQPEVGLKTGETYVSSLQKLQIRESEEADAKSKSTTVPLASKRKVPNDEPDAVEVAGKDAKRQSLGDVPDASLIAVECARGRPSAFASIMTSSDTVKHSPPLLSFNSYPVTFNFAEPSPDDIVTKAQSAKGRT